MSHVLEGWINTVEGRGQAKTPRKAQFDLFDGWTFCAVPMKKGVLANSIRGKCLLGRFWYREVEHFWKICHSLTYVIFQYWQKRLGKWETVIGTLSSGKPTKQISSIWGGNGSPSRCISPFWQVIPSGSSLFFWGKWWSQPLWSSESPKSLEFLDVIHGLQKLL